MDASRSCTQEYGNYRHMLNKIIITLVTKKPTSLLKSLTERFSKSVVFFASHIPVAYRREIWEPYTILHDAMPNHDTKDLE